MRPEQQIQFPADITHKYVITKLCVQLSCIIMEAHLHHIREKINHNYDIKILNYVTERHFIT